MFIALQKRKCLQVALRKTGNAKIQAGWIRAAAKHPAKQVGAICDPMRQQDGQPKTGMDQ